MPGNRNKNNITNNSNNLTQYNMGNKTNFTSNLNNGTNTVGKDQNSSSLNNSNYDVYIITGVGAGLLLTAFLIYYLIFKRKSKPMPFKFTPENHSSLYHPNSEDRSHVTLKPVLSVRNSLNMMPRSPVHPGPEMIPFSPQPQLLPLNNKIKH